MSSKSRAQKQPFVPFFILQLSIQHFSVFVFLPLLHRFTELNRALISTCHGIQFMYKQLTAYLSFYYYYYY